MSPEFKKGLLKLAVACLGFIGCYLVFGDIGIVFGAGLAYLAIKEL